MLDEKKEVELSKGRRHDSEQMRKKGPLVVGFRVFVGDEISYPVI